ncbi:MAG: family 10 glycosylhydrolase, partial [Treponema sp.]|nr:family 10 glycosylhydrolase [Treponema sp.]
MSRIPKTRPLVIAVALAALAVTCATSPMVEPPTWYDEVLYRFVRFDDGTYGYDFNSPVAYHRFTDRIVRIPDTLVPAKRQFRSAWVATVHNLDMPLAASPEEFRREFISILDVFQDWNMNALIFQVRPTLDAFYPSRINPWSHFLTGTQGQDPGWDPLEWMIAQTHGRGMEFHAWFNPYRVTAANYRWLSVPGHTSAQIIEMGTADLVRTLNAVGMLADNNFAVLHPEYVYRFNGRLYLDAGFPAVRQHVVDTIREVIENYDVDAIHFDDYFYPYRAGALVFGMANE